MTMHLYCMVIVGCNYTGPEFLRAKAATAFSTS